MPLVLAGATSGQATLQATDAATVTLTLPGTSGTLVSTGSVPAGGSNTQVQYNSSGTLAGSSGLTFSSGYLNIGTLRVGPDAGYNWIWQSGAGTVLGLTANGGAITFGQTSSEQMRLDASGNLGIGTVSPGAKLDVSVGQILAGPVGNNAYVLNSSGSNYGFISNNSTGVWSLGYGTTIGTLATPALSWNSSGKVGVGITGPNTQVQIDNTTAMGTGTAVADIFSISDGNAQVSGAAGDKLGMIMSAQTTLADRKIGLYLTAGNTNFNNPNFEIWQTGQGIAFRKTLCVTADTPANLQFNSGYGSVATAYGCRAWVTFNGTTSPGTIRASGNVSSVTKNGTGDYTVNFTNSMPDTNYCFQGSSYNANSTTGAFSVQAYTSAGITTSSVRIINAYGQSANTGTGARDTDYIYVAIFR